MKDQIISFETAKLAKEKGFNILCLNYYFEDGELKENELTGTNGYYGEEYFFSFDEFLEDWNNKFLTKKNGDRCFGCSKTEGYLETFSAPTQSLLQKWLREKYYLYTNSVPVEFPKGNTYYVPSIINLLSHEEVLGIVDNPLDIEEDHYFGEVLEIGLYEALKLIK